jgi:hypothetical protein
MTAANPCATEQHFRLPGDFTRGERPDPPPSRAAVRRWPKRSPVLGRPSVLTWSLESENRQACDSRTHPASFGLIRVFAQARRGNSRRDTERGAERSASAALTGASTNLRCPQPQPGRAVGDAASPYGTITGQRRGEAPGMAWRELSDDLNLGPCLPRQATLKASI